MSIARDWIVPDWPAPARVKAFITTCPPTQLTAPVRCQDASTAMSLISNVVVASSLKCFASASGWPELGKLQFSGLSGVWVIESSKIVPVCEKVASCN